MYVTFYLHRNVPYLAGIFFLNRSDVESYVREYSVPGPIRLLNIVDLTPAVYPIFTVLCPFYVTSTVYSTASPLLKSNIVVLSSHTTFLRSVLFLRRSSSLYSRLSLLGIL